MSWFPIGPDFVFEPRNPNFKRLSRRNETGRQGLAKCIAVDQSNPNVIYVVDRPSNGGSAAFRTDNGGKTWKCISDTLHQGTSPLVDPRWIAINPSHPNVIYLITYSDKGLYISHDKGDTWSARKPIPGKARKLIVDHRTASNLANTHLIAATSSGVHFSDDTGDTWNPKVPGNIFSLAAHIPSSGMAHFYAGVDKEGLYHANDPKDAWINLNNQDIGLPQFIAGDGKTQEDNFQGVLVDVSPQNPNRAYVWLAKPKGPSNDRPYVTEGIYTTASPSTQWDKVAVPDTTLSAAVKKDKKKPQTATPTSMTGIGHGVVLTVGEGDQQERVGVRSTTATSFTAVFTKDHAPGARVQVNRPDPAQGWYNFTFAVAPNSPGDGKNDILFFGRIELFRSKDAGITWEMEAWDYNNREGNRFHADQHSFAFYPENPPAGAIPVVYLGCDGGISKSSRYCDPNFDFAKKITDYNEGLNYKDTGLHQNLNHGKQCSALYQYTSYPDLSALSYIGCQDTGVNGGVKTFGWRCLADGDGSAIAIAPGKTGVVVWGYFGAAFYMWMWTDKGEYRPLRREVKLGNSSGPKIVTTSNYELSPGDNCLTGAYPVTTLSAAVANDANPQAATPASMTAIKVGTVLTVNEGGGQEDVTVTAITGTTFTAIFKRDHAKGTRIKVNCNFIARVDQDGIAHQISQNFWSDAYHGKQNVYMIVMPDLADPNYIVCATGKSDTSFDKLWYGNVWYDKVWYTKTGSTATASTQWFEVVGNKPSNANVNAIAITPDHDTFVLLKRPVKVTGPGGTPLTTPLFRLSEGSWIPQVCSGNPATTGDLVYGDLAAHPTRDDTLFATHAGAVYKLEYKNLQWDWIDISKGLPGQIIYDLWIGFSSKEKKEEHVVLRAGISTRGIWEYVVAQGEDVPATAIYMRDHLLDQGLLRKSEEGLKNPYNPTQRVWHYQCADIKIDVQQPASGGTAPFFQTDPEGGNPPFSHVLFDQLRDHSQSLGPGSNAWVHARVSNRSYEPVHNVYVWAIYCNAAAGVPALSKSASHGNKFDFWSQFTSTGGIIPNLPADSPWKAVGPPVELNNLDVFSPKVASWKWKIPTLATGDPGHYCMVVFVHGGACIIGTTSDNVDYMTPRNRQVGQKNLHIGPPLKTGSAAEESGADEVNPGAPQTRMNEYIEFHNPEETTRTANLRFDFQNLPPELAVTLQFTPLDTRLPLEEAMEGIRGTHKATGDEAIPSGGDPAWKTALCPLWNLLCAVFNWFLEIFGLESWDCPCQPKVPMPKFTEVVYEVEPGAQVQVRDALLGPFEMAAAYIRIRNTGMLAEGSRYPFEVQQIVNGELVGGSTYIVTIDGDPVFPPMQQFPFVMEDIDPSEWDRIERESKEDKYIPPWVVDIVREREAETEK